MKFNLLLSEIYFSFIVDIGHLKFLDIHVQHKFIVLQNEMFNRENKIDIQPKIVHKQLICYII